MKNVYNYHIREKKPNMHFKADGGSNPPLFKCVVVRTLCVRTMGGGASACRPAHSAVQHAN